MERMRYIFRGNVQGVGFRYRCVMAARGTGVTGWVENQWDGSVIVEAQGEPGKLEEFLTRASQTRYGWIDTVEKREMPLEKDERGFEVL